MEVYRLLFLMLMAAFWAPSSNRVIQKRAAFYIANETMCIVDGEVFRRGDPVPTVDHCERCTCRPPGFSCVLRECETKPDCKSVRRDGECCPDYVCGCVHNNRLYGDGEVIDALQNACYTCTCHGSSISCTFADCLFRGDCPPEYVDGECCPRYDHCPPLSTKPPSTIFTTTAPTGLSFIQQEEEEFLNLTTHHLEKFTNFPSSVTIQDVVSKVASTTTLAPLGTTTLHSVKFTFTDGKPSSIHDFDITTLTTLLPVTTAGYTETTRHVLPDGTPSVTTPAHDGTTTKGEEPSHEVVDLHTVETDLSPEIITTSTQSSKLPSDHEESATVFDGLHSTVPSSVTPEEPISVSEAIETEFDKIASTAFPDIFDIDKSSTEPTGPTLFDLGTPSPVPTTAIPEEPISDSEVTETENNAHEAITSTSSPNLQDIDEDAAESTNASLIHATGASSPVPTSATPEEPISLPEVTETVHKNITSTASPNLLAVDSNAAESTQASLFDFTDTTSQPQQTDSDVVTEKEFGTSPSDTSSASTVTPPTVTITEEYQTTLSAISVESTTSSNDSFSTVAEGVTLGAKPTEIAELPDKNADYDVASTSLSEELDSVSSEVSTHASERSATESSTYEKGTTPEIVASDITTTSTEKSDSTTISIGNNFMETNETQLAPGKTEVTEKSTTAKPEFTTKPGENTSEEVSSGAQSPAAESINLSSGKATTVSYDTETESTELETQTPEITNPSVLDENIGNGETTSVSTELTTAAFEETMPESSEIPEIQNSNNENVFDVPKGFLNESSLSIPESEEEVKDNQAAISTSDESAAENIGVNSLQGNETMIDEVLLPETSTKKLGTMTPETAAEQDIESTLADANTEISSHENVANINPTSTASPMIPTVTIGGENTVEDHTSDEKNIENSPTLTHTPPPQSTDSTYKTTLIAQDFSDSSVTKDFSPNAFSESSTEEASDFRHTRTTSVFPETMSPGEEGSFGKSTIPRNDFPETTSPEEEGSFDKRTTPSDEEPQPNEIQFSDETGATDDIQEAESAVTDYSYEATSVPNISFPAEEESTSFPVTEQNFVSSFGNDSNSLANDENESEENIEEVTSEDSESTFPATINEQVSSTPETLTVDEISTGFEQNQDAGDERNVSSKQPIIETDALGIDSDSTNTHHSASTSSEQESNTSMNNSSKLPEFFIEDVTTKQPEIEASTNVNTTEADFGEETSDLKLTEIDSAKESDRMSEMSTSTEKGISSDGLDDNSNSRETEVTVVNDDIHGDSTEEGTTFSESASSEIHYSPPSSTESSSIQSTLQTDILEGEIDGDSNLQEHETLISTSDDGAGSFSTNLDTNEAQHVVAHETHLPVATTEDYSPIFSSIDDLKIAESSNEMKLDNNPVKAQSEETDLKSTVSGSTYESTDKDDNKHTTEGIKGIVASTETSSESFVHSDDDQTKFHTLKNKDPLEIAEEHPSLVNGESLKDTDMEMFDAEEDHPGPLENKTEAEEAEYDKKDNLLYENSYSTPVPEYHSPTSSEAGDLTSISGIKDSTIGVSLKNSQSSTEVDTLPLSEDKGYIQENVNKSKVVPIFDDSGDEKHEHEAMPQDKIADKSQYAISTTVSDFVPTNTLPVVNKTKQDHRPNTDRVFELFELISENSGQDSNKDETWPRPDVEDNDSGEKVVTDSNNLLESSQATSVEEGSAIDDSGMKYESTNHSTFGSPSFSEAKESENLQSTVITETSVSGFDTTMTSDLLNSMESFHDEIRANVENAKESIGNSSNIVIPEIETVASLSEGADKNPSIDVNTDISPDKYISPESESQDSEAVHNTILTDHLPDSDKLSAPAHATFNPEISETVTFDKNKESYPTMQSESNTDTYGFNETSSGETTTEKPSSSTVQIEVHFGKVPDNILDFSESVPALHSDSALIVADSTLNASPATENLTIENNASNETIKEIFSHVTTTDYNTISTEKPVMMHIKPGSLSDEGLNHLHPISESETATLIAGTAEGPSSEAYISQEPEETSVSETTEHEMKSPHVPQPMEPESLSDTPLKYPITTATSVIDSAGETNVPDYEIMSAEDETEDQPNTPTMMTQNIGPQNLVLKKNETDAISETIEPPNTQTAIGSTSYESSMPEGVMGENTSFNKLSHSTSTSKPLTEDEEEDVISQEAAKHRNITGNTEQTNYEFEMSTDEVRERPISATKISFNLIGTHSPPLVNKEIDTLSGEMSEHLSTESAANSSEVPSYETDLSSDDFGKVLSSSTESNLAITSSEKDLLGSKATDTSEEQLKLINAGEKKEHTEIPVDQTTDTDIFYTKPSEFPSSVGTITPNEDEKKFYLHDSEVNYEDMKHAESMALPVSEVLENKHSVMHEAENPQESKEDTLLQPSTESTEGENREKSDTYPAESVYLGHGNLGGIFITGRSKYNASSVHKETSDSVKENIVLEHFPGVNGEKITKNKETSIEVSTDSSSPIVSVKESTTAHPSEVFVEHQTSNEPTAITTTPVPSPTQSVSQISSETANNDEVFLSLDNNETLNFPLSFDSEQIDENEKYKTTIESDEYGIDKSSAFANAGTSSYSGINRGIPNEYKLGRTTVSDLQTDIPPKGVIANEGVPDKSEAADIQDFSTTDNQIVPKTETTVHLDTAATRYESETPTPFITPLPVLVQNLRNNSSSDENMELKINSTEVGMTESRRRLVQAHDATLARDKEKPYVLHPYSLTDIVASVFKAPGYDSEVDADLLQEKNAPVHRVKRNAGGPLQTTNKNDNGQVADAERAILVEGFGGKPNSYFPVTSSFIVVYDESENEADSEKQTKHRNPVVDSRYAAVQLGDGSTVTMKRGILPLDHGTTPSD